MTTTTPKPPKGPKMADVRYEAARARRAATLENVEAGMSITQAWSEAGMSAYSYAKARSIHPDWAAQIDVVINGGHRLKNYNGTHADFFNQYFGHKLSWFQLLYMEELAKMPPGNILVAIFPPAHGKTSMFEDYVNMKLALEPNHRFVIAAANQLLARKMLGRIKNRMEPMGPTRSYVREFGPFEPQTGVGRNLAQPWGADYFNVWRKAQSDERDYSVNALGVNSEIIGSRCEHLHVDDPQSTKTLGRKKGRKPETVKTEDIAAWFHQDALSRPGEHGITTVSGTRIGKGDFLSYLMRQQEMIDQGIMKIMKFPVIVKNPTTGKPMPLWPERYTLEQLERMRVKAGDADYTSWDTQYMMNPEAADEGQQRTFTGLVDQCLNGDLSFDDRPTSGSACYVMVDPALGGHNVTMVVELVAGVPPKLPRMILRYVSDVEGLRNNESIFDEIEKAVSWAESGGARVTDCVIEAMNFQAGLARDTRLREMSYHYGFALREHFTRSNKGDAEVGVPGMARMFMRRQIDIPYKDDVRHGGRTREIADEFRKQLNMWEPGVRGTELVQDQVMAMWFGFALWESRWRSSYVPDGHGAVTPDVWKRTGLTYAPSLESALVVPDSWRF